MMQPIAKQVKVLIDYSFGKYLEIGILTIGVLKLIYSKHIFRARGQKSQMFICVTAKHLDWIVSLASKC